MSDTGNHAGKPPKYDGKGGRSFEMWIMKYKAWMHNVGIGAALSPRFDGTLPPTEATILGLTKAPDKEQSVAKTANAKGVNGCVLAFKTADMMNT